MSSLEVPIATWTRSLRCQLFTGRALVGMLTTLALVVYIGGFRAAGFSWYNAIGAGTTHVLPGALLGVVTWQLQRRIQPLRVKPLVHVLLAAATAVLWLAMVMAITIVAKPGEFQAIAVSAGPSILASGTILYTSVAMNFALQASHRRANERDAAAARAELAALRSKVEPHFLFNVLETVAALVRNDRKAAEEAIETVGRMLRRALDHAGDGGMPDSLVSVSEEMALVRDYLSIEKLRMGERLNIIERIDNEALPLGIPAFTIQSLVENAIKHGLAPTERGGELSIAARHDGQFLVLVVADDGKGANENRLLDSRRGVSIVRERLGIHFGPQARFDVAASPGHGVSVRVEVPAREAE